MKKMRSVLGSRGQDPRQARLVVVTGPPKISMTLIDIILSHPALQSISANSREPT
jgi:hypothetical protein